MWLSTITWLSITALSKRILSIITLDITNLSGQYNYNQYNDSQCIVIVTALSRTILCIITLDITNLTIITFSTMTVSKLLRCKRTLSMTLSIMTISLTTTNITTLSRSTLSIKQYTNNKLRNDKQYCNNQHDNTQKKSKRRHSVSNKCPALCHNFAIMPIVAMLIVVAPFYTSLTQLHLLLKPSSNKTSRSVIKLFRHLHWFKIS